VATVLVDTGFLVALYIRGDTLHCPAREYLRNNRSALLTVAPVVVEACFFLDAAGKSAMLNWIGCGSSETTEPEKINRGLARSSRGNIDDGASFTVGNLRRESFATYPRRPRR
jgi:predicted nucleic acid-binding protein